MTTLATLIEQLRNLIGDTSATPHFSTNQLSGYLNQALAEISTYFPRRLSYTLSAIPGEHEYALETSVRAVLACEYPAGQHPPRFLRRLDCSQDDFWQRSDAYDLILPRDASSLNPPRLVVSASVRAGESLTVHVLANHNPLSAPNDETTLPERYHHLLLLAARLRVWQELASKEGMDPNPMQVWTMSMEINVVRAERQYRNALKAALAAESDAALAIWFREHIY